MIELTPEQRRAVAQQQKAPVRALHPDTATTYVLMREDIYNRVKGVFAEKDDDLLQVMYPHVMEVFGKAGWDDPAMDVYDELDPRRQQ